MSCTENSQKVEKVSIGTRLSSELYNGFVNYLQDDSRTMPSEEVLNYQMTQTMKTSAKKTNNCIRKKFRAWTRRMVFSNGLLKHKASEKTIIAETDFLKTIKSIHESTPRHLNITQTVRQIKSQFTWTSKNFGMNLSDVLAVFCQCNRKGCQKRGLTFKDRLKSKNKNNGMSVQQNNDSTNCREECDQEMAYNELLDQLVSAIHSMQINVKLCKVNRFRKYPELRESFQSCEKLIQRMRTVLNKPQTSI